jgi:hypothetical protein
MRQADGPGAGAAFSWERGSPEPLFLRDDTSMSGSGEPRSGALAGLSGSGPVQGPSKGAGRGKCRWHRHRRPMSPGIQDTLPWKKSSCVDVQQRADCTSRMPRLAKPMAQTLEGQSRKSHPNPAFWALPAHSARTPAPPCKKLARRWHGIDAFLPHCRHSRPEKRPTRRDQRGGPRHAGASAQIALAVHELIIYINQ